MSDILRSIDAAINFLLGILLLLTIPFPRQLSAFLGVPTAEQGFYPGIMGGGGVQASLSSYKLG